MKRSLLIVLIMITFENILFAQKNIESHISVKVCPIQEDSSIMSQYKLLVDQEFNNVDVDTLDLKLEKTSFFNQIMKDYFFRDMKIIGRALDKDQWSPVDYSFDGETLKCKSLNNYNTIKVSYTYCSDYFTKIPEEYLLGTFFFNPYLYSWHSWFFVCSEMKINYISFLIPDNLWYFMNVPTKIDKKKVTLDIDNIQDNDISFYLLEKKYYDKTSFISNTYANINLYINKGVTVITDSISHTIRYEPALLTNNLPCKYKNHITKIINRLILFFGIEKALEINIADAYLTIGEKGKQLYTWGQNISINKDCNLILIDTSAWNNHVITHELIHVFNPCKTSKKDSAHFFFDESLVEFLAVWLDTENANDRDSIFNDKSRYVAENDSTNSSVFQISDNRIDLSKGNGSSNIIYQKTPLVIYRFAKKIGEERFIRILKNFYNQIKHKNEVRMSDLEMVAKTHGVTDEEWNWFTFCL